MITIAVVNNKGGVGKTTTAYNLAYELMARGYYVLGIDSDSQGNFSDTWGSDPECVGLPDLLSGEVEDINDAIQHGEEGQFDLISGGKYLRALENSREFSANFKLRKLLKGMDHYEYCIIDTPPAVSTLTIGAMIAADYIVITATPEAFSLDGLVKLNENIIAVHEAGGKAEILGILLTRYRKNTRLAREMTDVFKSVAEKLGTSLFETFINESMSVKEAEAARMSCREYNDRSQGAMDYHDFADEVEILTQD